MRNRSVNGSSVNYVEPSHSNMLQDDSYWLNRSVSDVSISNISISDVSVSNTSTSEVSASEVSASSASVLDQQGLSKRDPHDCQSDHCSVEDTVLGGEMIFHPLISLAGRQCIGFEASLDDCAASHSGNASAEDPFWLLGRAVQQLHFWQRHFLAASNFCMTVSLSEEQWLSQTILAYLGIVEQQLAEQCFKGDVKGLILEIEYSTLIANLELSRQQIVQLRTLGIQVQVGQFIPSHSSLAKLDYCKVESIKIKQDVLRKLSLSSEAKSYFQQVFQQLASMAISVTVSSVETPEQVNLLTQIDCSRWKMLCAMPISSQEATLMIYSDSRHVTANIQHYLLAMNHLSQAAEKYLGGVLVKSYWEKSKPQCVWLHSRVWLQSGCFRVTKDFQLSSEQINDLEEWVSQFMTSCSRFIQNLPSLVMQSSVLSPAEAELLGL